MINLSPDLSRAAFRITKAAEVTDWLQAVAQEVGTLRWLPLGGIEDNVHTVEVASDPALALVERPINGMDALLDLRARELGETAPTPHAAAQRWWGVPPGGLANWDERGELAALIRVTMLESGDPLRPTITIQDGGTGQHPDDFPRTLLSLLASNKKVKMHLMGVYNAGGAASCRFARSTLIASRLAPQLLNGRQDEVGVSLVRYDPLDPERYKSGTYQYLTANDGSILRLNLSELPDLGFGTYVKLIEYELSKYARAAYEPKSSLWHLFHAALPSPPIPIQVVETRANRFSGVRGGVERRTVAGLLHLLGRPGVADYSDVRTIDLGSSMGSVELRYYVLNEGRDPDAYVGNDQGLTVTLNGQRQITRDRYWVKRNLELTFISRRLIIVVDGTDLTNAVKRDIFSSTREMGADTPAARLLIERVLQELEDDEHLAELDELARQRVLTNATKTTTAKVKRQLASQIDAYLKGALTGTKGGTPRRPKRRRPRPVTPPTPPNIDDSLMLDVPDRLGIITNPVRIHPGSTAALRLEINAKNDFLPRHADGLSVVVGPALASHVQLRAKGRLLGGRVRLTLEASPDAPLVPADVSVALVVPSLGVLLTATGRVEVTAPKEEEGQDPRRGGEPDIDINWVGRDRWPEFDPPWDAETVGICSITRADHTSKGPITKVEWVLNEHFRPLEKVVSEKSLGEEALQRFRENYVYPVSFAMFKQRLAEDAKEQQADEEGRPYNVPDDYVRGEIARMARAVLMAMEPEIAISEEEEAA